MAADDLVGLLGRLRAEGARVVAADAKAERRSWDVDFVGPTVLLVGSEAHGLSEAVQGQADEAVAVPMPGGGESLNAAVAVAVLLYEVLRQRQRGQ
jgi:TrmH family RNA methyltransferase